jgi:hypothetical protein
MERHPHAVFEIDKSVYCDVAHNPLISKEAILSGFISGRIAPEGWEAESSEVVLAPSLPGKPTCSVSRCVLSCWAGGRAEAIQALNAIFCTPKRRYCNVPIGIPHFADIVRWRGTRTEKTHGELGVTARTEP